MLDKAARFIAEFEGFSPVAYNDSVGYKTIGYGHLIRSKERFIRITKEQGLNLLAEDLNIAYNAMNRLTFSPLNTNQSIALLSFIFNLGSGTYQRSSLRAKINRKEYISAADVFLKYIYAGGVKFRGLERRRIAERKIFLLRGKDE